MHLGEVHQDRDQHNHCYLWFGILSIREMFGSSPLSQQHPHMASRNSDHRGARA